MKIYVSMPKGQVTNSFFTQENIELLESLGEVIWNENSKGLTAEELRDNLEGVDVMFCGWGCPKLTAEVLEKADKLKLVCYTAGSVANLVTDEMYDRGIRIVGGNEAFAVSVAEGAITHMLASQRRFAEYDCRNIPGGWKGGATYTRGLLGKTVGVVGYGAISRYLLTMLKPFQVKIKLFSNHTTEEQAAELGVQKADLEEIFSTCDIISLHCAKSEKTHHMVNDAMLSKMKQDALLVNTSRGDVVDEEALVKHIQNGHIRASLDVYDYEPLKPDHPLRELGWRVNLQPHLAGPTIDYRYAAARLVIDDVKRFQNGEPLQNEILPWRAKMMTK